MLAIVDWPLIYQVSEKGGEPKVIRAPDTAQNEFSCEYPYFLPDGRNYLFTLKSSIASKNGIYVASLDSNEKKQLLSGVASNVMYSDDGYLLFLQERTLNARPFDVKRLILSEESYSIATDILVDVWGQSAFSVSQSGTLIYRNAEGQSQSQFIWFDRDGGEIETAGDAGKYAPNFDLSPDEKKIAVSERDPISLNAEIYIIDTHLNDRTRLTFKSGNDGDVVWSPDGLRVGFDSLRSGNADIYEKEIDSIRDERILIAESENEWMEDWSQDGKYIIYLATDGLTESIRALLLSEDQEPLTIVESTFNLDEPHLSFDGKWLAYNSNKSGTWEIYITPFSETAGQEYKISTGSGVQPRWRKDGKELYYLTLEGKMMAVNIEANTKIERGTPNELFDTKLSVDPLRDQYDVSSDGKRFLLLKPLAEAESTPITVTFNWTKLLNQ